MAAIATKATATAATTAAGIAANAAPISAITGAKAVFNEAETALIMPGIAPIIALVAAV